MISLDFGSPKKLSDEQLDRAIRISQAARAHIDRVMGRLIAERVDRHSHQLKLPFNPERVKL